MKNQPKPPNVYYADTMRQAVPQKATGEYVTLFDESYYCIHHYDALNPFFMTLVSSSNQWLFISTTGGLSAGRRSANYALFPYYTVDKITENSENTGSKTILLVTSDENRLIWEPFVASQRGIYQIERNIYKNIPGTSIVFEEVNHDLDLTYRYAWRTSETFGFVKTSYLVNHSHNEQIVDILDGVQNVLPAHVNTEIQNVFSNLLDAYKYNELHAIAGLGMFSLSSRLTDLAEPSESLRTNTVWHVGLDDAVHLLSSQQLESFRSGTGVTEEKHTRGRRGAYFVNSQLRMAPNSERCWYFVADVEQDSAQVIDLVSLLSSDSNKLDQKIEADIHQSQERLERIVANADGLQVSSDTLSTSHHFANVLFNVMRGGVFPDNHQIDTEDLEQYISIHKPSLLKSRRDFFFSLPAKLTVDQLRLETEKVNDPDLVRLCYSYLPLSFSRRHGDPSRPWNRFEINLTNDDGSRKLNYQGNWRDIFQNWEALSYSYPQFIQGMISVFLNATTADGYNPYRITRDGIDWEVPDPNSAWANIGYWSDHQIIYLVKLLEVCERFYPYELGKFLNHHMFSYANVPYEIKSYADLTHNPDDTIVFDWGKEELIQSRIHMIGADGKLVQDADGHVIHATLTEKLLLLMLAKLVNFVPEGGIWMNTQRPEWNDANNALVGKGLSVVTLAYMRRYVAFFVNLLKKSDLDTFAVSTDIVKLYRDVYNTMKKHRAILDDVIADTERRSIMDELGLAGSEYRGQFYQHGLSTEAEAVSRNDLLAFLELVQAYIDHSLRANKRDDELYHAYNTLTLTEEQAKVNHLSVMLEGQVAILSSGLLSAEETIDLLQSLRLSDLYREDQHSYMLYPDRQVPGFLDKNLIRANDVVDSKLIATMHHHGDARLVLKDINGDYHFQGDIRNVNDVSDILDRLGQEPAYAELVKSETPFIIDLFEQVFNHSAFTGRSGTFFAFEGLGSIYWHMISKLLLAVQEATTAADHTDEDPETVNALKKRYEDVRSGIGFNKSPDVYGAFPTDPYSHTPKGQGAKQPGMTGMVKEEILTRFVELGIVISDGRIAHNPALFRSQELLKSPSDFKYVDIDGNEQQLSLPSGSLAFTLCQVPFVVRQRNRVCFEVHYADGKVDLIDGDRLTEETSKHIFARNGNIRQVTLDII